MMKQKNQMARELCHSAIRDELYHHGILGMHWGEKNGPPYPLSAMKSRSVTSKALQLTDEQKMTIKNLKRARVANLDKFGISPDNNILFISGYSGSGKSTTALGFKRPGDHVIHLDVYSEPETPHTLRSRDKQFDLFLNKHVPAWRSIPNAVDKPEVGKVQRFSKEYWNLVDNFRGAIEDFSRKEYKSGNRVIVEGIQIADEWLVEDKSYYSGKPVIVLSTNALSSMNRASLRDTEGSKNLVKAILTMDSPKEYFKMYRRMNDRLSELSEHSGASKKNKYVKEYIRGIGAGAQ